MTYDLAFRHQQALDPSPYVRIDTALHALTRAIEDCRNAGKDPEHDPAVLLLARHLGRTVTDGRPGDGDLRRGCLDAIAELRRNPALVALAYRGVGYDQAAKTAFHSEGRRALIRVADALGLADDSYDVRSNRGGPSCSGEITLHGEEVWVRLALSPMGEGREVLFRRVRGRQDHIGTGRNNWASVRDLVSPDRFAARLTRELSLTAAAEPTRLFA